MAVYVIVWSDLPVGKLLQFGLTLSSSLPPTRSGKLIRPRRAPAFAYVRARKAERGDFSSRFQQRSVAERRVDCTSATADHRRASRRGNRTPRAARGNSLVTDNQIYRDRRDVGNTERMEERKKLFSRAEAICSTDGKIRHS